MNQILFTGQYIGDPVDLLSEVEETTDGDALSIGAFKDTSYHVVIKDGSATVSVEASLDGSEWFVVRESTESEAFGLPYRVNQVRARVSSISEATVSVHFFGFKE